MARNVNRQVSMRIAAVLTALADLAERASARPRPILLLVLCLLRPAEALARCFVLDVSRAAAFPPAFFDPPQAGAGEPADALRLAAAFRLLAAVLVAIAAAGAASSGRPHSRQGEIHVLLGKILAGLAPAAADTS